MAADAFRPHSPTSPLCLPSILPLPHCRLARTEQLFSVREREMERGARFGSFQFVKITAFLSGTSIRCADTSSDKASGAHDPLSSLSAFLDGGHGARSDSSESLLGFSSSLFHEDCLATVDREDPPEYKPPPIQSSSDLEVSKLLDHVLYTLRELLPGPVRKVGRDDIMLEAWKLVHHDIKVLDPVVCFQGKDEFHSWLQTLAEVQAQLNLHDIYAERIMTQPYQICIYAIWTIFFPGKVQSSLGVEGVHHPTTDLNLSGETKFRIDGSGQIVCIESTWYVPSGGMKMLELAKKHLISIMHKKMHIG